MKKIMQRVLVGILVMTMLTGCGYYDSSSNNQTVSSGEYNEISNGANAVEQDENGYKLDKWRFANNFRASGYTITVEDYVRLTSNLSQTGIEKIKYSSGEGSKLNYKIGLLSMNHIPWEGSCYGMSATAALVNQGKLFTSDLHARETLADTVMTSKNISAINFYHFQQRLAPAVEAKANFIAKEAVDQIKELKKVASQGYAFILSYNWYNADKDATYGHCVVGYGLESRSGEKWSDSVSNVANNYQYRVLIYDCSYPEDEVAENHHIYFNEDGAWCIPGKNIFSTSNEIYKSETDNGALGRVVASSEFINIIDYRNGATTAAYSIGDCNHALIFTDVDKKYHIETSSGVADLDSMSVENSTYANGNLLVSTTENGENDKLEIYLPSGEKNYTIHSEEKIDLALNAGNCFISAYSDAAGDFTFKSDGSVAVTSEGTSKNCTVQITSDAKNPFGIEECNTLIVSTAGNQELSIVPSKNGLQVYGDNLEDVDIVGYVNGSKKEICGDTKGTSILLQSDKESLVIKGDEDGDGSYESTINSIEVKPHANKLTLKNKTVTYTGAKKSIGKAKITGDLKAENVTYRYFSDNACKKEVTPKKAGTYYVKAYAITDNFANIESNVAILTIKKAGQKISLAKSTYQIKSGGSEQIQVKTASTKPTFKKLSGDAVITISKSGKIKVKAGAARKTYKVKVSVTAKSTSNYLKATKSYIVTIKVK